MSEQTINLTQLLDTFEFFDTNKDGCISSSEVSEFQTLFLIEIFVLASISLS